MARRFKERARWRCRPTPEKNWTRSSSEARARSSRRGNLTRKSSYTLLTAVAVVRFRRSSATSISYGDRLLRQGNSLKFFPAHARIWSAKDLVSKHLQLGFQRDEWVMCFLVSIFWCVPHSVFKYPRSHGCGKVNWCGLPNQSVTLGK